MNADIIKGVGLLGKALHEVTIGATSDAILDVLAALKLFGVNTGVVREAFAKQG